MAPEVGLRRLWGNLHRRHLDESQRGMIAAKLANIAPSRHAGSNDLASVSQPQAAELSGNFGAKWHQTRNRIPSSPSGQAPARRPTEGMGEGERDRQGGGKARSRPTRRAGRCRSRRRGGCRAWPSVPGFEIRVHPRPGDFIWDRKSDMKGSDFKCDPCPDFLSRALEREHNHMDFKSVSAIVRSCRQRAQFRISTAETWKSTGYD